MRKQSGYTHTISWTEKHQHLGDVSKSFRTTKDAVELHLKAMNSTGQCRDIRVEVIPVVNSPFKL